MVSNILDTFKSQDTSPHFSYAGFAPKRHLQNQFYIFDDLERASSPAIHATPIYPGASETSVDGRRNEWFVLGIGESPGEESVMIEGYQVETCGNFLRGKVGFVAGKRKTSCKD